MVHNLQRLIYFVHLKNELNRKRRRFYYYMTDGLRYDWANRQWNEEKKPKHISRKFASAQYSKACEEMKAMTAMISELAYHAGAKLVWDSNWRVEAIAIGEKRIKAKEFPKYYEAELFEMEMFDGQK